MNHNNTVIVVEVRQCTSIASASRGISSETGFSLCLLAQLAVLVFSGLLSVLKAAGCESAFNPQPQKVVTCKT